MLDFGSVVLGGNVFGWTVDEPTAFAIFDAFVAGGGTSFDTADLYPAWATGRRGGESEEILGRWLRARGGRERFTIATKVAKWAPQPGLSAANIQSACEGSLRRLQLETIDLYYAHQDDPAVPQEETLQAFDRLVQSGKVRTLGVSNFTAQRLASALAIQRRDGLAPFEVSQDHWNVMERDLERTLVPLLAKEGLRELPYWPLASGFLTGKYRPGVKVDSARAGVAHHLSDPRKVALLDALTAIGAAHGVAPAAVALAWLRAQPCVAAPIASVSHVDQLDAIFAAMTLVLSADEVAQLSAILPPG